MVEKISVNVKVASLNVEHNFLIPCDMSVKDATYLVVKSLSEEYRGAIMLPTHQYAMLRFSDGKLLDSAHSFKQLGIVQGDMFLLM